MGVHAPHAHALRQGWHLREGPPPQAPRFGESIVPTPQRPGVPAPTHVTEHKQARIAAVYAAALRAHGLPARPVPAAILKKGGALPPRLYKGCAPAEPWRERAPTRPDVPDDSAELLARVLAARREQKDRP